MATCESKFSMKLLIDTKARRVLFAEAESKCVDFLFNILSLPIGTVIGLLKEKGMHCSLSNLNKSIENLSNNYIQPNQNKDILLQPKGKVTQTFYKCSNYYMSCSYTGTYVTDDPNTRCPGCGYLLTTQLTYICAQGVKKPEGSFVKESVIYMIMDDLVVKPMSTISSIALLNKFNVKDVSVLHEQVVNFGMEEAVELLKASFESKGTVLTSVFLSRVKVEK